MGPARKRLLLGLPILGVGCSLIAAPEDAHPTHPKRVLIVESYGRDITPWNVITPAFKNELARQWQTAIEFHESALETARNEESRAELAFVDYLRALYAKQPPDLVVPVGAAATQFWWRHLPVLFPSTPVVIGGIEHRLLKVLTLGANDTAVAIQFGNAQGGLDLIFQLLPATTNVVMVIGNSSLERFWMSECQESWTRFSERGQLVWYNTLSFPEICRRAAELPPRSILTYGIFWVDAAGVPHEQMRSLDQLSSVANAPIFGLFEEQLGHGIVGGRLISSESIGRETGRLAAQILRGESATNIPPRVLGASPPAFDWRELRRWNIDERLLPPDSVVMFRQIPVWQRYRGYIWSALTIIMLQAASILALALQRTRRRRAESAALQLSGRLITAQEEERRRIARDLHDDLNQRLALLSVGLDLAGREAAQSELPSRLTEMAGQVRTLSSQIHKLSYQLHPAKLDQLGLVAAARALCKELSEQSGLLIGFTHENVPSELPQESALCVYRVLQEALGNILRHSRATEAQAHLRVASNVLTLAITDNGAGFDQARARDNGGLGLLSMEERARLVHGRLTIRTRPGGGTRIQLEMPVGPATLEPKGGL